MLVLIRRKEGFVITISQARLQVSPYDYDPDGWSTKQTTISMYSIVIITQYSHQV